MIKRRPTPKELKAVFDAFTERLDYTARRRELMLQHLRSGQNLSFDEAIARADAQLKQEQSQREAASFHASVPVSAV